MNPTIMPHSIRPMNNVCPHCNALRFINEPLNRCYNDKVTLPIGIGTGGPKEAMAPQNFKCFVPPLLILVTELAS